MRAAAAVVVVVSSFFFNFIILATKFEGRKKKEITWIDVPVHFRPIHVPREEAFAAEHFIILLLLKEFFFFADCHPNGKEWNDITKKRVRERERVGRTLINITNSLLVSLSLSRLLSFFLTNERWMWGGFSSRLCCKKPRDGWCEEEKAVECYSLPFPSFLSSHSIRSDGLN